MTAICIERKKWRLTAILVIMLCCICALLSGCISNEDKKNDDMENSFIRLTANPVMGITPLNVSFYANTTRDKGTIDSYFWDFDDGIIATSKKPSHVFSLPGDYVVKFTLTFTDSASVSDTITIRVYDKSQFYGIWHYLEGDGTYDTIAFYPNEIINITTQKKGISYDGTYNISNETIIIDINQLQGYESYFYEINNSNILTLVNKKNRQSTTYIKQRKTMHTLYVGGAGKGNFSKIQEAIDNAWYGDSIIVYEGLYFENLIITKSINLWGEITKKPVIDGKMKGDVIEIYAQRVNLSNLSIRNSSSSSASSGIKIYSGSQVSIDSCEIKDNYFGIWLYNSIRNKITNCTIEHNKGDGIMMNEVSSENEISDCIISHNDRNGIKLCCGSNFNSIIWCTISKNKQIGISIQAQGNLIVKNNFINNNMSAFGTGINFWDDGNMGNYWSDFDKQNEGAYDQNKDNIIDTPYLGIGENNQDHYPLAKPYDHNR